MNTTNPAARQTAINPKDEKYQALLNNMQGNILKGHGRDNAWHLFLNFNVKRDADVESIREWLATLNITTAKEQLEDTAEFKRLSEIMEENRSEDDKKKLHALSIKIVSFFFLSHSGYNALQIDTSWLADNSFKKGMKNQRRLQDPKPATWDFSTSDADDQRIDAMLLIASDNFRSLDIYRQDLTPPDCVSIIHAQFGEPLRFNNIGIEHFGYADGVSQPLMLIDDLDNDGKLWSDEADPFQVALVKDESVTSMTDTYGSYFVFRKLDQNVKGFKKAEDDLGLDELGGAYVVGRFEDGTPVAKYGTEQHPQSTAELENDFNYKNDPEGNKCPFHAHTRMTNPRDRQDAQKPIRIVRRGITYDEAGRGGNMEWHPESGVGLLFMCYQNSIQDQFEKLQIEWANNGQIIGNQVATDGVIGQGKDNKTPQQYPTEWNGSGRIPNCSVSGFVTMKGGEYFFAPSIPFINGF